MQAAGAMVGLVMATAGLAGCAGPATAPDGGAASTSAPGAGGGPAWFRYELLQCEGVPWNGTWNDEAPLRARYPGAGKILFHDTHRPLLPTCGYRAELDVYMLAGGDGLQAALRSDGWTEGRPPAELRGAWYRFDLRQCEGAPWGAQVGNASAIMARYPGVERAAVRSLGGAYPAACGHPSGQRAYAILVDDASNATLLADGWLPAAVGPSPETPWGSWMRFDVPACHTARPEPWANETTDGPVPMGERARIHYTLRGAHPVRVLETVRNVTATPDCAAVHATTWFMQVRDFTPGQEELLADGWTTTWAFYCDPAAQRTLEDGDWAPREHASFQCDG